MIDWPWGADLTRYCRTVVRDTFQAVHSTALQYDLPEQKLLYNIHTGLPLPI